MFSLKRANKNLQKRARRASEMLYDFVGLSPRKELLRALLAGDEEKAIQIYLAVTNGKSLEQDMYPSLPLVESSPQTPMHLAAMKGMFSLLKMFFERGGNPNILNLNNETCLHAVCRESGHDDRKRTVLLAVLQWEEQRYSDWGDNSRGQDNEENEGVVTCSDTEVERVSVNMVDSDGNTACHYAARSGLEQCVLELVRRGAIISIVNKDQMTCCELADEGRHAQLANSLELALVFAPTDGSTLFLSEGGDFQHEADQPHYLPDACSFTSSSLWVWRQQQVTLAREALVTHSVPQIEALLDSFDWNINELVYRYMSDASATLAAANLTEGPKDEKKKGGGSSPGQKSDVKGDDLKCDDDVGHEVNIIQQMSQKVPEEREEAMCSICAENLHPSLAPEQLMAMTGEQDLEDRDQRRIDCGGGHSFCFSCWSTHLKMRVMENSCSALSCPAYQCGEALESGLWAECLLGADISKRFQENVCRRVVDSSVDFCWCPSKDCDLVIHVDEEARSSLTSTSSPPPLAPQVTVTCGNGHSVCLACKDVGHAPCSCDDFALWKTKVAKEIDDSSASLNTNDIATALWVQANTKKCPKCKTPIEKDEGCNHMTCKKCRYDFCWICMQRWENHSNRTGGYFQCNMFMAGRDSDEGDRDVEMGEDSLFSDTFSGGSSTKETLRLRKNAAIMDRFIQHYSSYKGHEDSVQLEVRMQFDTLERITEALWRSAESGMNRTVVGADSEKAVRDGAEQCCWLRGEEVSHPLMTDLSNIETDKCQQQQRPQQQSIQSCDKYAKSDDKEEGRSASDANECYRRGDVESVVNSSFHPILFLQRGFRELIKCRQFLKGFFPFSFYMLSEEHSQSSRGSRHHHPMLVESRKDAIDRVRADLETLTETLSNIVARKRLRASRSEIERATRAARSSRLEFESIIWEFQKACEESSKHSNKGTKHTSSRQRIKSKNRSKNFRSEFGSNDSRHGSRDSDILDSMNMNDMSIFDNIEFLNALARGSGRADNGEMRRSERESRGNRERKGDKGSRKSTGTPSRREEASSSKRSSATKKRSSRHRTSQSKNHASSDTDNILDMGSISFSTDYDSSAQRLNADEGALSTGGRSRSSSDSSSSSSSSVNIRQVGSGGQSITVQTKSPPPRSTARQNELEDSVSDDRLSTRYTDSLNHFALDNAREREYAYEHGGGSEEEEDEGMVEINRAILLSLQQLPPPPSRGGEQSSGDCTDPSEADIQALLVMGFDRDKSLTALRDCSNNVEDAVMLLLSRP